MPDLCSDHTPDEAKNTEMVEKMLPDYCEGFTCNCKDNCTVWKKFWENRNNIIACHECRACNGLIGKSCVVTGDKL